MRDSLHILHEAERIATKNFADVASRNNLFEQRIGDFRKLRRIFHAEGHVGAVEIGAEAT